MKNKTTIIFLLFWFCFLLFTNKICAQSAIFTGGNQVNIGDLDVFGDQITVEALINHNSIFQPNIISKHSGPPDVNYLFRPGAFEFTTTNGYQALPNPCVSGMQDDVWYHIAATYDGATAKYYVNGCLVASLAQTGNLVTNNLTAVIAGRFDNTERWSGYMDEVRIWNVARTQAQIAANMNNLVSPSTEVGLLAYYKFNGDLINSQGNATWDASGSPSIPSYTTEAITIVVKSKDCSCSGALPIELISFDGINDGAVNVLKFSTAAEKYNDYFTIQKSLDGFNWIELKKVDGKGTSTIKTNYSVIDDEPSKGFNYYQLSQTDIDGKTNKIGIIVIDNTQLKNNKVIRTTDLLGRDVNENYEGVQFIYYSNGRVQKKLYFSN